MMSDLCESTGIALGAQSTLDRSQIQENPV